jgi:hypothetical protein
VPISPDNHARWRDRLFSTTPADRPATEAAAKALYEAAGIAPPAVYAWFDSPCAGAWAIALLIESRDRNWQDLIGSARRRRDDRERIERVEAQLLAQIAQTDIAGAIKTFGDPLAPALLLGSIPPKTLHSDFLNARLEVHGDVAALFAQALQDPLQRAEEGLWGNAGVLRSGLFCHTVETLVSQSFFSDYSFTQMAMDEAALGSRTPPPLLQAAWTIARSVGPWWAWMGGAIFSDHPQELHVNTDGRLHRPDGPAAVYKDGWRVFAWEGYAMPEQWILDPASVPRGDLKNCPASFRQHAAAIAPTGPKPPTRPKKSEHFTTELPRDRATRVELLRTHADGRLPRFDRYVGGEYQMVWKELVEIGDDVRQDAVAADALAVAYETMARVHENVKLLVERLGALGYRFSSNPPHQPPGKKTRKQLQKLERLVGPLPLSLRAFYDVVGSVDLVGRHPSLTPRNSWWTRKRAASIPPDPLVVYGVGDALQEAESMDDEEREQITIAPDDLHKENVSGGDAYAIAVPDGRADAIVLNERHQLYFVEYLRLCCRLGGFGGYEGVDRDVPKELDQLRDGLLEF